MKNKLFALVLAAAGLAASGCVGYEVKPPKPAEYPKADAPVPLKVGVLIKKQPFEWVGMGMSTERMDRYRSWGRFAPIFEQVDGIGAKFVGALNGSRAFAGVDEVKSMGFFGSDTGGHNLFIDAQFSGKFTQDPAAFPKAFITGFLFFLPGPFIRYGDSFRASADLSVYDGGGRLVHKYSEIQDVDTDSALFSEGMPGQMSAGIESAATNLASKLVTELIADREGFVRASKSTDVSASRKPSRHAEAAADSDMPEAAEPAAGGPAAGAAVPAAATVSSANAPEAAEPASAVEPADSEPAQSTQPAARRAPIPTSEVADELLP